MYVVRCFWHGMGTDIKLYESTCATCNTNKKPRVKPKAAMQNYGNNLFRHIGTFTVSKSGKFILVVDQFNKWIELKALPNQTPEPVATTTVTEFISRMGCADHIFTVQ